MLQAIDNEALDLALPPHWAQRRTASGLLYYVDQKAKISTWMNPLFGQAVPMGDDSLLNLTPGPSTTAHAPRTAPSAKSKRRFSLRSARRGTSTAKSSVQHAQAAAVRRQPAQAAQYPSAQELAFADTASRDTLALFDDVTRESPPRSASVQSHERSQAKWQQLRHRAGKYEQRGAAGALATDQLLFEMEDREV